MSHLRQTVLAIALATAAIGALAQTAAQIDAQQKQHQAHVLATEQATANQLASPADPASAGKMAAMDNKMKAMAEMHQKMMATKTPEEKKALMAEHMKTMQEGMKMTGTMGGGMAGMQGNKPMPGAMGQHHQMMEKRMAMMESMMESMMQMMMDRMPAPAAN